MNMNNQHHFVTSDRDREKECATIVFEGEGYAGWQAGGTSCTPNYYMFPKARVPQRTTPDRGIEIHDNSFLMFRCQV